MRPLLLFLLAALPLMAAFPTPMQVVKLDYGQHEVVVQFTADGPIRKAKPLCDCTKVSIDGARLTARVDTRAFSQDVVEKQIDATTADGVETRLTMRFVVPSAVTLSARSFIWKQGAPAEPQLLTIRIPKGSPVHRVKEASLSGEAFDYTPRVVKEGEVYTVSIVPRSTEKKVLNRLIITTDSAESRYAQYIIYLSVQTP